MEKIIQELVNTLTDDQFLEFYEKVKQQAELIKKQKRLNEINQKFRAHGIKCPKCESYHCVKNGHNSEWKQKYLCKNCRASFDAFRNHFYLLKSFKLWTMKFIDSNFIAGAI
ncbi:IS1/IS1595 family N-terminal zinc-binding domain-containing protein [Spiroplasma endosymbiont of 'Nebria riversi']|uniref:IS1/IS1595 family N-terminal zinc-binding domain-containing protein n=1 Tax=Spiroplasma endosymbiont of 'Nebria riversi' TaxID=2792084 RepID=UPI003F78F4D8